MNGIRTQLRAARTSRNPLIRAGAGALYSAREAYRFAGKFVTDRTFRSVAITAWLRPGALHQTTTITWFDRYPEIFTACRGYFADRVNLRILSFGCSTGEEVVTLRKYFPSAWITGAEINARSLGICRERTVDARTSFIYSTRNGIHARGPFDAIFCMAVLQRTPHAVEERKIANLRSIYPFEKFERQLVELDEVLNPGGLLVVRQTQYRVRDTAAGARYTLLSDPAIPVETGPLFDRNCKLIPGGLRESSIFVKHE